MKLSRSVLGALVATVTAVGLGAAVNAPSAMANYDNCPLGAVCGYQDQNGTGPMVAMVGGGNFLDGFHFANTNTNVNDQISSVYNNSPKCVEMTFDFDGGGPGFVFRIQRRINLAGRPENDQFSYIKFAFDAICRF